jgi:hypothetical protein
MMNRREVLRLAGGLVAAMPAVGRVAGEQRSLPKSEFDYVDWSWRALARRHERWPSHDTAERQAQLFDLLKSNGRRCRGSVGGAARPSARRSSCFLATRQPRVLRSTQKHSRKRRKARTSAGECVQSGHRQWIPAFLLMRAHRCGGTRRRRRSCVPTQTTQEGKREPVGLAGNAEQLQRAISWIAVS